MKKFIIILISFFLITSCAAMREKTGEFIQEDLANVETTIEVAKHLNYTWPIVSGFLKGFLSEDMSELPQEIITAINKLDEFAKLDELTIWQCGEIIGLRARILSETAIAIFNQLDIPIVEIIKQTIIL